MGVAEKKPINPITAAAARPHHVPLQSHTPLSNGHHTHEDGQPAGGSEHHHGIGIDHDGQSTNDKANDGQDRGIVCRAARRDLGPPGVSDCGSKKWTMLVAESNAPITAMFIACEHGGERSVAPVREYPRFTKNRSPVAIVTVAAVRRRRIISARRRSSAVAAEVIATDRTEKYWARLSKVVPISRLIAPTSGLPRSRGCACPRGWGRTLPGIGVIWASIQRPGSEAAV